MYYELRINGDVIAQARTMAFASWLFSKWVGLTTSRGSKSYGKVVEICQDGRVIESYDGTVNLLWDENTTDGLRCLVALMA